MKTALALAVRATRALPGAKKLLQPMPDALQVPGAQKALLSVSPALLVDMEMVVLSM